MSSKAWVQRLVEMKQRHPKVLPEERNDALHTQVECIALVRAGVGAVVVAVVTQTGLALACFKMPLF